MYVKNIPGVHIYLVYISMGQFQLDYADFQEHRGAVPPQLVPPASLKVLHTHAHATNLDSFGFCFICMLHS